MCGIAGFSLHPNHRVDSRRLAKELLLEIVARGHHATGMAWTDNDGEVYYHKQPMPAERYIREYMDVLPSDARTVILHTRYATKGSPRIEENNHPIMRPGIVGVHNGVIHNDDEIFSLVGSERYGQVDSEAAFTLLADTELHPTEAITFLEGRVALSWIETSDPRWLHVARYKDSPLAIAQTKIGSFVFASTLPMLKQASARAGLALSTIEAIPEGWYLRVRNGRIHDALPIGLDPAELLKV